MVRSGGIHSPDRGYNSPQWNPLISGHFLWPHVTPWPLLDAEVKQLLRSEHVDLGMFGTFFFRPGERVYVEEASQMYTTFPKDRKKLGEIVNMAHFYLLSMGDEVYIYTHKDDHRRWFQSLSLQIFVTPNKPWEKDSI